jgi:SAM-dependent methyltransferase
MRKTQVQQPTYRPEHFARLLAVEDRHFWFRVRNRLLGSVIGSRLRDGERALEIGCGNGAVVAHLAKEIPGVQWVGGDPFLDAVRNLRARSAVPALVLDAFALPMGPAFDGVGLFDVIEHLDEPVAALREARRVLRPGGHMFVTVPAHTWLWSRFDVVACHRRRYTRKLLMEHLSAADLDVVHVSHFMAALVPVMFLSRRRGREPTAATITEDELRIVPGLNELLGLLLSLEIPLASRIGLPFGSSILAIARRPVAP